MKLKAAKTEMGDVQRKCTLIYSSLEPLIANSEVLKGFCSQIDFYVQIKRIEEIISKVTYLERQE